MKIITLLLLALSFTYTLYAQEPNVPDVHYKPEKWNGVWITNASASSADYSVVLFRKKLTLAAKPVHYIINITADNRYKLYINNQYVGMGPQGGDIRHWRYETLDIARFLNAGDNVIAAEVVNFGVDKFFGQQSVHTAFLLNGFSDSEKDISTNSSWKTYLNKAYSPKPPNWMYGVDITGGFYASNPGDSINAALYPWGWKELNYDDNNWQPATWFSGATAYGGSFYWILMPRTTPLLQDSLERFTAIARTSNLTIDSLFLNGNKPCFIPAHTKTSFLIDQQYETLGYPVLEMSGGKGAVLNITYAENLFGENNKRVNRNVTEDKTIHGLHDVYVADGGDHRSFSPLWFRAFRFIQVEIETKEQPVTLNDYYNVRVQSTLPVIASFQSDNNTYDSIMQICRRTAMMCMQENLISDAYYEQMQYVGDSRVHAMVSQSLTGSDVYLRNAIQQFSYSRLPDGNITSCYPLKATFVHPTFSLLWIDMIAEYMMYDGDKNFIRPLLSAIPFSLSYFEDHRNTNGLIGETNWPCFVDWYPNAEAALGNTGIPKTAAHGNSSLITLHYVYSLQNAAAIFAYMGKPYEANLYRQRADSLKQTVYTLCFDKKKGLLTDDPQHTFFDQRSNIMAVLTDAVPAARQNNVMQKIISDTSLSQAGLYYRYNLFAAMAKTGTGDLYDAALKPWKTVLDSGLTTTPEVPLNMAMQRSECHPWSTSPAFAFFSVVCGIQPSAPAFSTVSIAPQLGALSFVSAVYPVKWGNIIMRLKKQNSNGIAGTITLPKGLRGTFIWRNKIVPLHEGTQTVVE